MSSRMKTRVCVSTSPKLGTGVAEDANTWHRNFRDAASRPCLNCLGSRIATRDGGEAASDRALPITLDKFTTCFSKIIFFYSK
jgi:hypothetical protein